MMKNKTIAAILISSAFAWNSAALLADDSAANTNANTTTATNTTTNSSAKVDDATLTDNVNSKIKADPNTANTVIVVKTQNGIVILTGQAKTDDEASAVIESAQSVDGVKDVDTANLTVQESKHPLADMAITAKVKGNFIREKLFGDKEISVSGIKVETKNGVVHLSGKADTKEQIATAIKLAKSVSGVKAVKAKILVEKNSDQQKSA